MPSEICTTLKTSLVPLESSVHGEERRDQRNISKHELKAAVKYGTKEPANDHATALDRRWKYTFADIIYITDETSVQEITSWRSPLPFPKIDVTDRSQQQYVEGKRRIKEDKDSITSLTVCVVDKSGSMKKSDVTGHRTRARAVYFAMGEQYLAPLINREGESHTDLITVIEMRETPTVVVDREPRSWTLFNRLVELSEERDERSHGFYRRAIVKAFKCLKNTHIKCALSLIFLSDGRPSDQHKQSLNNIITTVRDNSRILGERFNFTALGFGTDDSNFATLKTMIDTSRLSGAGSSNFVCGLDSSALKTLFSSADTSLTKSRSILSRLTSEKQQRELAVASDEKEKCLPGLWFDRSFDPLHWNYFSNSDNGKGHLCSLTRTTLEFRKEENRPGKKTWVPHFQETNFLNPEATGIAIRKKHFESGAERIVYGMFETDADNRPVGPCLVAKDSKYRLKRAQGSETVGEAKFQFHQLFLHTQHTASKLARKFNERVKRLQLSAPLPLIRLLNCSVYFCKSEDGSIDECWLCEEMISPFKYKKWNDNKGGVDGIARENFAPSEDPLGAYSVLLEEHGEEECWSDDEQNLTVSENEKRDVDILAEQVLDTDIPQAFSHFSYVYTEGDQMVCDIQGQLDVETDPSTFLLTDACVHRRNRGGRRELEKHFGRTDHGVQGMMAFFATHHCNAACKLLGLRQGKGNRGEVH